ncbi:2-hydroxy-3-oxopropionate reductase [Alicyclobacillus tolerans]|uniref:2-hydroxy-3-oxopropionate reductase n=1 Tax=Alicyclobacillus tolerans TaxID=90970 RepID=UPI001F01C64A|nr:2-hydroxy-3-oxopropionate reductase [Alicyclobacillus tolerans]MCF8566106.1 2-hydroxy-3-oxopropionate reductase [Alicyclobacillus tolerans]
MSERIGFIGLGVMGKPMAANLLKGGFSVTVHNRSQAAVQELVQQGASAAATPAEVAASSDVVITMLPDTPDVEQVYFGESGLLSSLREGMLFVDMTTASPGIARKIYDAVQKLGADSLDAPVSGGDVGAREGTLSIMVGGSAQAFERAMPVFNAIGKNIVRIGEAGAGQVAKACNQVVVALTIEAVGEALTLAAKSGVDPAKVRDALLGGFAQSRILDLHGKRALEHRYDPGFRVKLHRKDLAIALETARSAGVSLPGTALVGEMMNALIAQGMGDEDHSALIRYLAQSAQTEI